VLILDDIDTSMHLYDRLKWRFLSRFQTTETQRILQAQYRQWEVLGYSRIVNAETLLIAVLLFISRVLFPVRFQERARAFIYQIFGLSRIRYETYATRYLDFWDPQYIHTRFIICYVPRLIPSSCRELVLGRYQNWVAEATQSPASVLNDILDHIESRELVRNWDIHVRNIVEFTIWERGLIEKAPHLQSYGQWLLKDFPRPDCSDPVRYAIAASVMEQLVDVFNWRTEHGIRKDYIDTGDPDWVSLPSPIIEEVPGWAKVAPPSPQKAIIQSAYFREGMSYDQVFTAHGDLDPPNPHFLRRNLIADANFLQFA
jgi:hypothetical protein